MTESELCRRLNILSKCLPTLNRIRQGKEPDYRNRFVALEVDFLVKTDFIRATGEPPCQFKLNSEAFAELGKAITRLGISLVDAADDYEPKGAAK